MLDNDVYENVPISVFNRKDLGDLSDLLDEDILVRQDLISESVIGSNEVINFTFDECRDFLLSDYLLNIMINVDKSRYTDLIEKLTQPERSVAEGLQEYLFYASRQLRNEEAIKIIKKQSWYSEIYLHHVFYLDESDITEEDDKILRETCVKGDHLVPQIVCELMIRYDTKLHPHANIELLFDIFDALTDDAFDNLCEKTFGSKINALEHGLYPIDKLTEDIGNLFRGKKWQSSYEALCAFLLYLWNLKDSNYSFPVRRLYELLSEVHPVIVSRLKTKHATLHRKGFKYIKSTSME
jgi:hypothetical protein